MIVFSGLRLLHCLYDIVVLKDFETNTNICYLISQKKSVNLYNN